MTDDQGFIENDLRIACADAIELVTEYLESALSAADLEDFEAHLSLCEGCQVFLDQVKQTVTLTSHSRDTTIPLEPGNMDALLAALDERASGSDEKFSGAV